MNTTNKKMHAGEIDITQSLIQRLIAEQFPEWSMLEIKPIHSLGTSHVIYRLGDDMFLRLPRVASAVDGMITGSEWLSKIASYLPVSVPTLIAKGMPTKDYPFSWSICRWVDGKNPVEGQLVEPKKLALDLARFIKALHTINLIDGPLSRRGVPLFFQDKEVRVALNALSNKIDVQAVLALWERALLVPAWDKRPVWVHGDLMPGNILLKNNRLSAIIDFDYLGMGDPAIDLIPAWNLLPAQARPLFRNELQVDDATWERGRGWALSMALIQLPYYEHTNPVMAANARFTINEVLLS